MKTRTVLVALVACALLPVVAAWSENEAAQAAPAEAQAAPAEAQAAPAEAAPAEPVIDKEKVSYTLGVQMGSSLKQIKDDINAATLFKGLEDALNDRPLQFTQEEMREIITGFRRTMMAKQQEEMRRKSEENATQQKAFLEENGKKEGVVTLPSGMQYKVLTEGEGNSPAATDRVKVHYKGTLPDGTVFDSSYDRGEPVDFQVNGVIPGWTEALQLMKPGAKWELYIPAELAYGAQGRPPRIGPNQMLVFEVELKEILPPEVTVPSQPAAPEAAGASS